MFSRFYFFKLHICVLHVTWGVYMRVQGPMDAKGVSSSGAGGIGGRAREPPHGRCAGS